LVLSSDFATPIKNGSADRRTLSSFPHDREDYMFRTTISNLLVAAFMPIAAALHAQNSAPNAPLDSASAAQCATCPTHRHVAGAVSELLAFELMPYSVNRWIGGKPEDQTTLASWSYNLRHGWGWDNDHFPVNQFAHPYSGALFFNSARAHGYNFWQSAPFALAGSGAWEYFGETTRPSINDLANTTLGGITLGETMYHLSSAILDGRSTGAERVAREFGAAVVDPPRALTRILNGDVARIGSNTGDHSPSSLVSRVEVGYQRMDLSSSQQPARRPPRLFANYSLAYGDPLAGDVQEPFGALRITGTLATGVAASISEMRVLGFLAVHDLENNGASHLQLAAAMHYHYNNNRAFTTGGQGFSGGLISRYQLGRGNSLRTELWLTGIVLGAVKSDFGADAAAIDSAAARSYDYGSGAGGRILARFDHGSQTIVDLSYEPFWYDVLSGVAREHYYDVSNARVQLPLFGTVAVGAREVVYRRVARYASHPTAHTSDGQTQLFVAVAF
jgi:hypothetical protein